MAVPMMPIYTSNTSFVRMPAKEVLRLATASILEIEDLRRRAVNEAVERALDAECTHFFGLVRHKQFRDRDHALSTMLLDNERLTEERNAPTPPNSGDRP